MDGSYFDPAASLGGEDPLRAWASQNLDATTGSLLLTDPQRAIAELIKKGIAPPDPEQVMAFDNPSQTLYNNLAPKDVFDPDPATKPMDVPAERTMPKRAEAVAPTTIIRSRPDGSLGNVTTGVNDPSPPPAAPVPYDGPKPPLAPFMTERDMTIRTPTGLPNPPAEPRVLAAPRVVFPPTQQGVPAPAPVAAPAPPAPLPVAPVPPAPVVADAPLDPVPLPRSDPRKEGSTDVGAKKKEGDGDNFASLTKALQGLKPVQPPALNAVGTPGAPSHSNPGAPNVQALLQYLSQNPAAASSVGLGRLLAAGRV